MGEHTPYRQRAFGTAFQTICNSVNPIHSTDISLTVPIQALPTQLGVTRDALLDWALEIYSKEVFEGLKEFQIQAKLGALGLQSTRRFSNSIHHFAHAIVGKSLFLKSIEEEKLSEEDKHFLELYPDSTVANYELRTKLWRLLKLNLKHRRVLNQQHVGKFGTVLEDWPETIKVVAEAGNNILQLGSTTLRRKVAFDTKEQLEEILSICHSQQQAAVMQLLMHLHGQIALIDIADHHPVEALESFERAVAVGEQLSQISGEHILTTPLSQMGNVLGMLHRYDEAAAAFERAISLAEKHIGSSHTSLAMHLVNFGILQVMRGHNVEGEILLLRGRELVEVAIRANILLASESELMHRIEEFLAKARGQ